MHVDLDPLYLYPEGFLSYSTNQWYLHAGFDQSAVGARTMKACHVSDVNKALVI